MSVSDILNVFEFECFQSDFGSDVSIITLCDSVRIDGGYFKFQSSRIADEERTSRTSITAIQIPSSTIEKYAE